MAKHIDTWECSICTNRFDYELDAIGCEAEHVCAVDRSRLVELLNKHFPLRHELDTGYEKHCVSCGKVLLRWEREFDGIETHKTNLKHVENHKEILHGRRCEPCATAFTDKILNALDAYDKQVEKLEKP